MEVFGIVLLATLVEGFVEYVVSNPNKPQPWLKYVSLVLGVVVAFAYNVDILALAGLVSPFPYVGAAVSGIIIGRGGNYVNDFIGLIRSRSNS